MTIDEIITNFKSLNLTTNPEEDVRKLISQVGVIAHVIVTLHKGKSIIRARPNNEGDRF